MMRWSIYYGDFSRYDGITEEHALWAPVKPAIHGVMFIKQEADKERGYDQRHSCSFYCWYDFPIQHWDGHDNTYGHALYLMSKEGPQKTLLGRTGYDILYQQIGATVTADGTFDEMDFRPGKLKE